MFSSNLSYTRSQTNRKIGELSLYPRMRIECSTESRQTVEFLRSQRWAKGQDSEKGEGGSENSPLQIRYVRCAVLGSWWPKWIGRDWRKHLGKNSQKASDYSMIRWNNQIQIVIPFRFPLRSTDQANIAGAISANGCQVLETDDWMPGWMGSISSFPTEISPQRICESIPRLRSRTGDSSKMNSELITSEPNETFLYFFLWQNHFHTLQTRVQFSSVKTWFVRCEEGQKHYPTKASLFSAFRLDHIPFSWCQLSDGSIELILGHQIIITVMRTELTAKMFELFWNVLKLLTPDGSFWSAWSNGQQVCALKTSGHFNFDLHHDLFVSATDLLQKSDSSWSKFQIPTTFS
jgi:hypothetical protein